MDNYGLKRDNHSPKKLWWFNNPRAKFPFNNRGGEGDPPPEDWKATLPPEIKDDPSLAGFQTVGDMAKSFVNAQKFLGREKLPMPTGPDDKDTLNLIFKTLGLPEKPENYEFPTDLQIPENLPIDEELTNSFRKTSHELGLLPKQVAGLYRWFMQYNIDSFNKAGEAQSIASQEAENALRKRWGAAYGQNVALARKVFNQFADEEALAEFEKGYGNNLHLIELFANIGKVLSEDQMTGKPAGLTLEPAEALAEIKKMEEDLKSPLYDATHPHHREAIERKAHLYKLAYPSK